MKIVKLFDGLVLRAKFTTEERSDGKFIATYWTPEHGYEVDRDVFEYETYSAALAYMFEMALMESLSYSNLRIER